MRRGVRLPSASLAQSPNWSRITLPVSGAGYTIFLSNVGLEICLLWRMFSGRHWRHYPYFLSYLLYDLLVSDLGLYSAWILIPLKYPEVYWGVEILSLVLRFLVIWEILRYTFVGSPLLARMASHGIAAPGVVLLLCSVCAFWALEEYGTSHSLCFALERGLGLGQGVVILGVLLLGGYYGIRLGRNLWGVAVGFGGYLSISVIHYALFDMHYEYFPHWQALVPLSFDIMLLVWLWALWDYAPNAALQAAGTADTAASSLWWERWKGTLSTARKVVRP